MKRTDRCNGNCCKRFCIAESPEQFAHEAQAVKEGRMVEWDDGSRWWPKSDTILIHEMLIPLVRSEINSKYWFYTCKHWDRQTGLCQIYEKRPEMCRDYGVTIPCEHSTCVWEGALRGELSETKGVKL